MSESIVGLRAPCTISAALKAGVAALGRDSRLDAELLLGMSLALDRSGLLRERDRLLLSAELTCYGDSVLARRAGVPLAYLLGRREFWSLEFEVDPRVLIPRADTECLVDVALELLMHAPAGPVADLGTGSGAVAVAISRERRDRQVLAIDDTPGALALAQRNIARHAPTGVALICGDWLTPVANAALALIVSNPPYVEEGFPDLLSGDLRHEPRHALAAGPDGLEALKLIIHDAPRVLVPAGWIALEHGAAQGAAVRALLSGAGFASIETRRDAAGQERVTAACNSQGSNAG